jgi:formylglycine-generating enzyme required for sulfatase activity
MEWVADFLGTYPATLVSNPTGPASGEYHVARGGSFKNYNWFTSSYHRFGYTPGTWSFGLGFRCANSIP